MTEIETTLAGYITREIMKRPSYNLRPAEALISGGLIDSFHLVDLVLFIEATYGVHIDDSELNVESFDTLAQLAELVRVRQ